MNASQLLILMADNAPAGPPPVTYFPVSDDFNRPDDATTLGISSSGAVWVAVAGTWGISANQACFVSGAGTGRIAVIETGHSDVAMQVDVVTGAGSHWPGLTFRLKDAANWVAVRNTTNDGVPSNGLIVIMTSIAGTTATVTSAAAPAGLVFPYTMRAELSGSTVTVKINGAVVLTATVTAHVGRTRHGLFGNSNTSVRLDNFTVTSL